VVLLKILVFWNVTACHSLSDPWHSSQMSCIIHPVTQCHIPDDLNPQLHYSQNVRSYISVIHLLWRCPANVVHLSWLSDSIMHVLLNHCQQHLRPWNDSGD
jgi:hypothetical protein